MGKYEPAEIRLRKHRLFLVALYHHHSTKHANHRSTPREYVHQRLLFHLILLARTIRSKPSLGGNHPVIHSLSKGNMTTTCYSSKFCTASALQNKGRHPSTAPFMNGNRIESSSPSNLKYIPRLSPGLRLQHPLHPSSVLARLKQRRSIKTEWISS
jgi:hypothetical protein